MQHAKNTKRTPIFLLLPVLMLILNATGCDSSNTYTPPTQNLKVTDIQSLDSSTAHAAHPFEFSYMIETAEEMSTGVTTDFYLVENDELAQNTGNGTETEMADYVYLGTDFIQTLDAGESQHFVEFIIPASIKSENVYFIIAHIDPFAQVREFNESDNAPEPLPDSEYAKLTISISKDAVTLPNLKIESVSFDSMVAVVDTDDDVDPQLSDTTDYHGNAELKGYLYLTPYAAIPAGPYETDIRMEILVNGTWETLELWDNETQSFQTSLIVDFEEADFSQIIDLDVNIPDAVLAGIYDEITATEDNRFTVKLSVDALDMITELDEDDNDYQTDIRVHLMPEETPNSVVGFYFEKQLQKHIGDPAKFKAGVDLYAKAGLDLFPIPGALMRLEGVLPITIFNAENKLIEIQDKRAFYAGGLYNTGYQTKIKFLDEKIYEAKEMKGQLEKTFGKKWKKENPLGKARFMVGPVPISVEAGVKGEIEFSLKFGLYDNFYGKAKLPELAFSGYGKGGVDIVAASAGVAAELLLIEEKFNADASVDLNVFQTDNLEWKALGATINSKITNEIDAISGKFGLYAKWKSPKICRKWGIPYPCGLKEGEHEFWLYKTRSLFKQKATLLNKKKQWYASNDE